MECYCPFDRIDGRFNADTMKRIENNIYFIAFIINWNWRIYEVLFMFCHSHNDGSNM